jgi:hypothetical protein
MLIACFIGPLFAFATTVTWDGGANNSNWSDAANWDGNMVPGITDMVVIGGSAMVQVNSSESIGGLTLQGDAQLTINSGNGNSLNIVAAGGNALQLLGTSKLILNGKLDINATVTSMGQTILLNTSGSFTIAVGGELTVNGFSGGQQQAITMQQGTFTNNGSISLDFGAFGIADAGQSTFENGSTGTITMTHITRGISYDNTNAIFTNNGSVIINATGRGVEVLDASNILSNNGSMTITSSVDTILYNGGAGSFKNNSGGILKTIGSGSVGADRFVNNGGKLSPGASPGIMYFTGSENFDKSTWVMEIAGGGGVAGTDFDQIVIQNGGTATLTGAILNVDFGSFTPMVNQKFKLLNATAISGTFAAINVTPAYTVSFDYGTGELTVNSLLPVELIYFQALPKDNDVLLIWQTASETDNEGYEVQRSTNGNDWETIDFVRGHGTTHELHNYSFLDKAPSVGINYYRLRQIDSNRDFLFSAVVTATIKANIGMKIYPNPVNEGFATVFLASETALSDGFLNVFDQLGRNIWHQTVPATGENNMSLPLDFSNFAPGIYTLCLEFLGRAMTEQIEVVR